MILFGSDNSPIQFQSLQDLIRIHQTTIFEDKNCEQIDFINSILKFKKFSNLNLNGREKYDSLNLHGQWADPSNRASEDLDDEDLSPRIVHS